MEAPGFQRRRTLKQNMKKSLSDRVSCWVLGCGDVGPRSPSRTLLPPCGYRYVRLVYDVWESTMDNRSCESAIGPDRRSPYRGW